MENGSSVCSSTYIFSAVKIKVPHTVRNNKSLMHQAISTNLSADSSNYKMPNIGLGDISDDHYSSDWMERYTKRFLWKYSTFASQRTTWWCVNNANVNFKVNYNINIRHFVNTYIITHHLHTHPWQKHNTYHLGSPKLQHNDTPAPL